MLIIIIEHSCRTTHNKLKLTAVKRVILAVSAPTPMRPNCQCYMSIGWILI